MCSTYFGDKSVDSLYMALTTINVNLSKRNGNMSSYRFFLHKTRVPGSVCQIGYTK